MNKARHSIIAITTLTLLSACVSEKSYNFRQIATDPYELKGKHATLMLTNNKVIEMDVEDIQGNHLYGEGQYVPISVIKSAKTQERGLPEGVAPVRVDELPTFLMAGIVWAFPLLIILGVTAF